MPATTTHKIQLTDDERALARRSIDKAVFVALVEFTGPRGRKYRSVRTAAKVTEGAVLALVQIIHDKRYANNATPGRTTLFQVDALGNVLAAEVL